MSQANEGAPEPPVSGNASNASSTWRSVHDDSEELSAADLAQARMVQLRASKLVANAVAGAYRSSFLGSGIEFEEVRPYQPGDDVRTIDWKVTARTREPHIKTYREERQLRVVVVVDVSPSMDFGSKDLAAPGGRAGDIGATPGGRRGADPRPAALPATKRRAAGRLAALLAAAASKEKDAAALQLFAGTPLLHLEAEARRDQSLRFYREVLGQREPGSARGGLERCLNHLAGRMQRHSLVFVISDFHDVLHANGSANAKWESPLGRLAERHDLHCVRIVDPLERELPRSLGRMALTDMDSGQVFEIDAGSERQRAAWSDLERRRAEAFAQGTRRARAHSLTMSADERDPAVALVGHLDAISRRGGRR